MSNFRVVSRLARDIMDLTQRGPRRIDIAQSLIDRYFDTKPTVISQRPLPASLNPLIAEVLKPRRREARSADLGWASLHAGTPLAYQGFEPLWSAKPERLLNKFGFQIPLAINGQGSKQPLCIIDL